MSETPPEVAFAQKLASNEQKVRDRALKKLKKYLTVRSSQGTVFTRDELSKLWKGLHYAMWAQDKPLVQEDLSKRLCNLLKAFIDPSSALEFAAAFFAIEANEWNRIDVFRMDKFMMLIRDFLNATLEVVKADGWKTERVAQFASIVGEEVLDPRKENNPDGLRLHLADIYLDELNKVASEELDSKAVISLLEPFMHYIVQSSRDYIVDKITKNIFNRILEQTSTKDDTAAEEASKIKYDLEGICAVLFNLAKDKNVLQRNRKKVYKLIKRFPQATVQTAMAAKRKLDDDDDQSTEMPSKKTKNIDHPELNTLDCDEMKHLQEELSETSKEAVMATTEDKLPERNQPGKEVNKRKKKVQKDKNSSSLKAELTKKNKKKKMAHLVASPAKDKMASQIKEGASHKRVSFALERNAARGLQEFITSASTTPTPFHPSRSPKQGILKESPRPEGTPRSGLTAQTLKGAHHSLASNLAGCTSSLTGDSVRTFFEGKGRKACRKLHIKAAEQDKDSSVVQNGSSLMKRCKHSKGHRRKDRRSLEIKSKFEKKGRKVKKPKRH